MFNMIKPYMKRYYGMITFYGLVNILQYITFLIIPIIISRIISSNDYHVNVLFVYLLFFVLLAISASGMSDLLLNRIVNGMSNELALETFMKILHAPLEKINNTKKASTISTLNNCCFFVPNFYIYTISSFILNIVSTFYILYKLLSLNIPLSSIVIFIAIVQLIINRQIQKKRFHVNRNVIKAENKYKQSIHVLFKNWKSSKLQGFEHVSFKKVRSLWIEVSTSLKLKNIWVMINDGEQLAFSHGLYGIIVVLIILNNDSWNMDIGNYEVFFSYTLMLIANLNIITMFRDTYNQTKAHYTLYQEMLFKEEKIGEINLTSIGTIEFKNVSYGFDDKQVIDEFNYKFTRGNIYVIKGENGSGKSTLINLISGLYYPRKGNIMINGVDSMDIDVNHYRRNLMGILDQQTIIFEENLLENIYLSANKRNDELTKLYLSNFNIDDIDQDLNCKMENLSGGQKQKIGIIRMLLKASCNTPGVLLLDEPMNHMDKEGKEELVHELLKLKDNNIIIIISHDDSFDSYCKDIVYL